MNWKRNILLPLALLALPVLARFLWFNQGIYQRAAPVKIPDYATLSVPQPVLSTALPQPTQSSETRPPSVVIFDFEHGNMFNLPEIEPLTSLLAQQGARVEVTDNDISLSERLKYAHAYVVIAPTSSFSAEEILEIRQFVERGGRLLVIADPTRNSSDTYYSNLSSSGYASALSGVDVANLLLAPFNIIVADDYLYNSIDNEGNFRNVIYKKLAKSPLTEKVSQVVFYGSHSLKTKENLIMGDENTFSSLTDQAGSLAVAAAANAERVLVLGDLNFMTVPYNQVADNQQFIHNIARFLMGAGRVRDLKDLPYLFNRPVTVLTKTEKSINKEYLGVLSTVQESLQRLNLPMLTAKEPQEGSDLLVLSLIPPEEEVLAYIEPFNLQFLNMPTVKGSSGTKATATPARTPTATVTPSEEVDSVGIEEEETGEIVVVPGLGKFSTDGIGLILFSSEGGRNMLILMAATDEALRELTNNVLDYGDLSNCLIQGQVAACQLDSRKDDAEDYSYDNFSFNGEESSIFDTLTKTPAGTGTPEVKGTPEVTLPPL